MSKIINHNYAFLNYAIALFFLATPIESIAVFEGFSIAKLSALVVFAGWTLKGFKTSRSAMIKSFVVLALYASMTIIWSIDRTNTSNQLIKFLWPSIIVAIAMNYSIRCNEDIFLYLKAYIVGCLISTVATFLFRDATLAAAEYAGQERLTAFGQDQNTLAFLLCTGFTIVLDFFRKTRNGKLKYLSIALLLSFVIVILSTGSRTGLILTAFVFGLYFMSSGSLKNFVLMILLVLLLSPVIYNYIPESIWDRFLETNDLMESGNYSGRGRIWSSGLSALARENYVLGVGYSNFSTMLRNHFGWQMASHNTYLSYLADLGMVGFLIFLSVLYQMFMIVRKIYKVKNDIYVYAYIIPFLVVMFVLETEYKRWLFIFGVMLEAYFRLNYSRYYQSNH